LNPDIHDSVSTFALDDVDAKKDWVACGFRGSKGVEDSRLRAAEVLREVVRALMDKLHLSAAVFVSGDRATLLTDFLPKCVAIETVPQELRGFRDLIEGRLASS
jgi:hypothetical protein